MRGVVTDGKRRRSAGRGNRQPCPYCRGSGYAAMCDEAELIHAIARFVGNRTFSVSELMTYAMVTGGPLRDAIGDMSSVQVGKMLRGIFELGKNYDGFTLERQGVDNAGARWRVRKGVRVVSHSHFAPFRKSQDPHSMKPKGNANGIGS